MDFPGDRARGTRKKGFSPNQVEVWLDAWCLPCLQDAMENSTLKLMFVHSLSALPTKLHGEHCAQAYDCFPSYGYSNPIGYETSDFRLLWTITPNPQPPKPPMIGLCPPPPYQTCALPPI